MTKPQEPKRVHIDSICAGIPSGEFMLAEEALAYAEAVREHCREFYIHLTVSTLVGLHGVSVEARDLALELGVSLEKAKVLGLSEYDMQNLTELAEFEPKLKEGK